jgi:hypothetical protein
MQTHFFRKISYKNPTTFTKHYHTFSWSFLQEKYKYEKPRYVVSQNLQVFCS